MELKITKQWFDKMVKLEDSQDIQEMNPIYMISEELFNDIVAKAIDDSEKTWYSSITLESRVDGVDTWKAVCPDLNGSFEYVNTFKDWREDAVAEVERRRHLWRAQYIRTALENVYNSALEAWKNSNGN